MSPPMKSTSGRPEMTRRRSRSHWPRSRKSNWFKPLKALPAKDARFVVKQRGVSARTKDGKSPDSEPRGGLLSGRSVRDHFSVRRRNPVPAFDQSGRQSLCRTDPGAGSALAGPRAVGRSGCSPAGSCRTARAGGFRRTASVQYPRPPGAGKGRRDPMILQAVPPVPPTPPTPPFDPNLIFLNDGGPPVVLLIIIAALTATVIILWPLMRAFGRRLEGKGGGDAALRAEVEQLQLRAGEVDALHHRVAELEERVDFTERLLAQTHDPQSRAIRGEAQ